MKSLRVNNSTGSVLVLLAAVSAVLIMFIALAVDVTRVTASQTQKKRTAEMMALAAVEDLSRSLADPNVDVNTAIQQAAIRAESLGAEHSNGLVGRPNDPQLQLGQLRLPNGSGTGDAGEISLGQWWFEEPVETCASYIDAIGSPDCPCATVDSTQIWQGACFDRFDNSEVASNFSNINALNVDLRTPDNLPIPLFFSRIMGINDLAIRSSATAALVPRNSLFMVDLSKSMTYETFPDVIPLPEDVNPADGIPDACVGYTNPIPCTGEGPQMAYPVGAPGFNPPPAFANCTQVMTACMQDNPGAACPFKEQFYRNSWARLPTTRGANTTNTIFKSDYQCFILNDDYRVDTADNIYLINTRYNPATNFRGPEPLNTVLRAIGSALQIVQSRSVVGDRVGLIAFDKESVFPNSFRLIPFSQRDDPAFQELEDLTEVDFDTSAAGQAQLVERINNIFFPRVAAIHPDGTPRAVTDIPGALFDARQMFLNTPNFSVADNFVFMFSDGLSVCRHGDAEPGHFIPSVTANGSNFEIADDDCSTYWKVHHGQSMLETAAILSNFDPSHRLPANNAYATFSQLNIAFHMFMIGDSVMPHTMLIGDPDAPAGQHKCLTDNELRRKPFPVANSIFPSYYYTLSEPLGPEVYYFVPDNYNQVGELGKTFLFPNLMFYTYGATGTSGVWAPLRPPCVATNAQALVDAACSQAPTQPAPGFIMPFSIPRVTTDVSPSHLLPTNDNGEPPLPVLACDPQRRSKAQQAMDEINKIYNQNPYILVN